MKNLLCHFLITTALLIIAFVEQAQAYYNPEEGRFINRDPIEERGGENVYGFLRNDGVNKLDKLGMQYVEVGDSNHSNSNFVYHGSFVHQDAQRIAEIKRTLRDIGQIRDKNNNECFLAILHYDPLSFWDLHSITVFTIGEIEWIFHLGHGWINEGNRYLALKDGFVRTDLITENVAKNIKFYPIACYHNPNYHTTSTCLEVEKHLLFKLKELEKKLAQEECKDCSSPIKKIVRVTGGGYRILNKSLIESLDGLKVNP